jgi:hypothetical protein
MINREEPTLNAFISGQVVAVVPVAVTLTVTVLFVVCVLSAHSRFPCSSRITVLVAAVERRVEQQSGRGQVLELLLALPEPTMLLGLSLLAPVLLVQAQAQVRGLVLYWLAVRRLSPPNQTDLIAQG